MSGHGQGKVVARCTGEKWFDPIKVGWDFVLPTDVNICSGVWTN